MKPVSITISTCITMICHYSYYADRHKRVAQCISIFPTGTCHGVACFSDHDSCDHAWQHLAGQWAQNGRGVTCHSEIATQHSARKVHWVFAGIISLLLAADEAPQTQTGGSNRRASSPMMTCQLWHLGNVGGFRLHAWNAGGSTSYRLIRRLRSSSIFNSCELVQAFRRIQGLLSSEPAIIMAISISCIVSQPGRGYKSTRSITARTLTDSRISEQSTFMDNM